jgi:D-inositol-3-phosphate glycosyltransferase
MKKIGFVICSTGWGGLEINVLKLAKWLNQRNWEVLLYVLKDSKLHSNAKDYLVNTYVISDHKKYFDFQSAYRFSRILKQHDIETLFAFDNKDLDMVFLTKKMAVGKLNVIYQQQMQIGINKKDWIHTMRFSAINHWISPLELLKKEVIAKTKLNPEKITVIPLCTEIEKFVTPKYSKKEAREKLNLDIKDFYIGIMGRIDPQKGQLFLVKAIHELQQQGMNVKLVIVGEPTVNDPNSKSYFSEIKQYIDEHGLSEVVLLKNFTNDVSVFYNAIDVFALASQGETFGMVTVEAMLSGLPIIATNTSGTPEILNNGELGLLYTPNHVEEFCKQVHWISEYRDKALEMGSKAKETAKVRYSHITECENIEKLIGK